MFEYTERKFAPVAAGTEFVLSDGHPDRMGDIIEPDGWQIDKFSPIALFNHSRNDIIGRWDRVRVEDRQLKGALVLAEAGTSPIVDMTRALVEQGLLDTVSVGFRALDREPLDATDPFGPQRFKKAELLEASLVSVPANPRARRIAKQFLPEQDYRRLCAASGVGDPALPDDRSLRAASGVSGRPSQPGKSAASSTFQNKGTPMEGLAPTTIGKKIEFYTQALASLKDQLTAAGNKFAESESPTDEQKVELEHFTAEIDAHEKQLEILSSIEARVRTKAAAQPPAAPGRAGALVPQASPHFVRKEVKRSDYVYRVATGLLINRAMQVGHGQIQAPVDTIKSRYGDEATEIAFGAMVMKAAMTPGTTTTAGWAAELVTQLTTDFLDALPYSSIYRAISARGQRYTFGRNGSIKIPVRSNPTLGSPGALNGSFVGEGNPIPVRRLGLTSITLTPKKMAVISEFTKELDLHSTPSIEAVVRTAITSDTTRAIDAALVDAVAADTVRPAGLLAVANTPGSITPSVATATYDKIVADLKGLQAYIIASGGNPQTCILLANPAQAGSLAWVTLPDGSFPFPAVSGAQQGDANVRGIPMVVSSSVPAGKPIMLDTEMFASVTTDTPEFDVSDVATVHEEDTTPLAIATGAQGSGVLATPTRSFWQTYTMGIRMVLPMNWAMLRTGMVATFSGSVGW